MLQPVLKAVLSKLKRSTVTTWWNCPALLVALLKIYWSLSWSGRISVSSPQMCITWWCVVPSIISCCWLHQAELLPQGSSSSSWSHFEAVAQLAHSFCRSVPMKQPLWCRRCSISTLSSQRFLILLIFAAPQMLALPGSEEKRQRGGMGSQEDAVRKWLVR